MGGNKVVSIVSGVAVTIFQYPFAKARSTLIELAGVAEANERLQQALRESTLSLTRLQEINRENERLRAILDFAPPAGYELLHARVISISGELSPVSAEINRGQRDSVTVDMPVINQQGLIGRVVSVFEDVATVQLLIDPTHRVAARVAETREMGIAKYSTRQGLLLGNVPIQGRVDIGHQVLSSGLGGIYPAGLVIGTVLEVRRPEESPFCEITLEPAANFNSIEEVFVLKEVRP